MVLEYFAVIGTLSLYLLLEVVSSIFADVAIFIFFLFIYANIPDQSALANFYLFGIIFVIIARLASRFYPENKPISSLGGFTFRGNIQQFGLSVGLGVVTYVVMRLLQGNVSGSIIGTPSLAISSPYFGVSAIILLGIIENKMFFTIFNLIKEYSGRFTAIPYVGGFFSAILPGFPFLLVSLIFGVFHFTAYSSSVSNILFASFVMVLWLVIYVVTKSDTPANIAHGLWNGLIQVGRLSSIAT